MKYELVYKMMGGQWSEARLYLGMSILSATITNLLESGFMVRITPINA